MYHFGLIGYPLQHSLSPEIHQQFFAQTGLQGTYTLCPMPPETLSVALPQWLETEQIQGFNVTLPHKVSMLQWVSELTQTAVLTQAVNTVSRLSDGRWLGHNTDAEGYWNSVPQQIRQHLPGKAVVVLGTGGAARAVLTGLLQAGCSPVYLIGRGNGSQALIDCLGKAAQQVIALNWADLSTCLKDAALLVNTSSLGLNTNSLAWPYPFDKAWLRALPAEALVSDIVYKPLCTPLLQAAQAYGLTTHTGLGMLIEQAALAFKQWTGVLPNTQTIRLSAHEADFRPD